MLLPWQNPILLNLFITKTPQWRPGETISSAFHRDMWYHDSQKSGAMLPLGEEAETWASFGQVSSHAFHPQSTHESIIVLGVAKNPNSKCQDGQAPCKDVGVGVGELALIFWLVEVCGIPTLACGSITQNPVFFFTKPFPWTFRFTSVSPRIFIRSASTQSSRISQSVS